MEILYSQKVRGISSTGEQYAASSCKAGISSFQNGIGKQSKIHRGVHCGKKQNTSYG